MPTRDTAVLVVDDEEQLRKLIDRMNWWHAAQVGLLRCCSSFSRMVLGGPASLSMIGGMPGGGGGTVPHSKR